MRHNSQNLSLLLAVCLAVLFAEAPGWAQAAATDAIVADQVPGLVVDDTAAEKEGTWTPSVHTRPFVNQGYVHASGPGHRIRFAISVPEAGAYQVFASYTANSNRTASVEVIVHAANGPQSIKIDQRQPPQGMLSFHRLGEFEFDPQKPASVEISTDKTQGVVISDAVWVADPAQWALAQETFKAQIAASTKRKPATKTAKAEKKPVVAPPQAPEYVPVAPARDVQQLTSSDVDQAIAALLAAVEKDAAKPAQHATPLTDAELASDEEFLRRVSLDLTGRQPSPEMLERFAADGSGERRAQAINHLLASPHFGENWANYWSDVMAYRQQEPQLTFHDYRTFKAWLASELNSNVRWDQIVYQLLTPLGKVGENPAATFIAFHQADSHRLAGETSRVFLGMKIACAECHDHPFVDMPQETFHGMAAFFTRTEAKIPWNDSDEIQLVSKTKGEHAIPGKKGEMPPTALDGETLELGIEDIQRRATLARWVVSPDNSLFAKAYVNRVWARLMGRGFCEPVDDLGDLADVVAPELHDRLADHFVATGYDVKDLFQLITSTKAYQRRLSTDSTPQVPFAAPVAKPLRGDEVFDSLVMAIALPNVRPEPQKATSAVRFPVPPKSTRDLVNHAYGYDPSFADAIVTRSMKQAMFMMNNEQIQQQVNAKADSGTMLAQLLQQEKDNSTVIVKLYRNVLGRHPSEREQELLLKHLESVDDRGVAFEDVLWSLLNSAEFITRH